jgi:hypothetical protein
MLAPTKESQAGIAYTLVRRKCKKIGALRSGSVYSYKTIVTDYEGMQESLLVYGSQGWKLVSVSPDTWRIVVSKLGDSDTLGLGSAGSLADSNLLNSQELSASYYLLVFEREDDIPVAVAHESAVESLDVPDFSLPDY